jgi:hypothetical protein
MATNNSINDTEVPPYLAKAGGTMAGAINMGSHQINAVSDPTLAQDAATKNYVDLNALNGTSVYAATTGNLTVTQSGAGVGATLTNNGAQATFALDGVNPPLNSNVLVKNLAAPQNEGIYTVTNVGSGASNWVLTRANFYDTTTDINSTGLIVIQNGSTLAGTAWYNAATIVTVDTTAFSFSQFGNIVFPITLANGGTNASLTASNGGIFYSTASAGAILGGTATAGLALLSGSSTTPSWSTKPPITQVNPVILTSTQTYTPTAGTKFALVKICGGGGGSGGCAGTAAQAAASSGGAGAGYCEKLYTIAGIGANAALVIGAAGSAGSSGNNAGGNGGNSTFTPAGGGGILTANGGAGGSGSASTGTVQQQNGSTGGTASGGDINIPGGGGMPGWVFVGSTGAVLPGNGGNSFFATTSVNAGSQVGAVGNGFGGGGSGSQVSNANTNVTGAAGTIGICYITEYISV